MSAVKHARTKPRQRADSGQSWLSRLWTRWLQRRLPAVDHVRLGRKRLFIMPVREGTLFMGVLVIMLLTGINYQNSLVYLLTFLLGALFYVGIVQTHDNLSGLQLSLADIDEGFAGTPQQFTLRLKSGDGSDRPAIEVFTAESGKVVHLRGDASEELTLGFIPGRRGLVSLPRIQVETHYPMGLFRAWSYLWLQSPMLVYPRPIEPPTARPRGDSGEEGEQARAGGAASDELLLRPYRPGDPLPRLQWKRYARNEQMVVTERELSATDSQWLDYADFPGTDPELRLGYLSWLVEDAHARQQIFGLRLPGTNLKPGSGPDHRRSALRLLALFQSGDA